MSSDLGVVMVSKTGEATAMAHASGLLDCLQTALCLAACTACCAAATTPRVVVVPATQAAATGEVKGGELPLVAVAMVRD